MKKILIIILTTITASILCTVTALGEVYKCTTESGQTVYTEEACDGSGEALDIETEYPRSAPGMRASEKNYLHQIEQEKARKAAAAEKDSSRKSAKSAGPMVRQCPTYSLANVELFEKTSKRGDFRLCVELDVYIERGVGKFSHGVDGLLWEMRDRLWAGFDDGYFYRVKNSTFRARGPERATQGNRRYQVETCFGPVFERYSLMNIITIGCR